MQELVARINARLAYRKFVLIFGEEVDRVWPLKEDSAGAREAQKQAICDFGAAHGWSVEIRERSIRVQLVKQEPAGEKTSRSPKSPRAARDSARD